MKAHRILILLVLSSAGCFSAATAQDIKGKIITYGIYKAPDQYTRLKAPHTPSGAQRIYKETPNFTSVTDKIPARVGVRFGIVFELTDLPKNKGELEFVRVLKCPLVHKPDGTTSTGFEGILKNPVTKGRIVSWTGYGFDHDYELVPGIWTYEIKFNGKTVCKQNFTVFRQ